MLILLIDYGNICEDTNFLHQKKMLLVFLEIGKSLLLGNVLFLCIFL